MLPRSNWPDLLIRKDSDVWEVMHVLETMQDQPSFVPIEIVLTHNMQNSKLNFRVSRTFRRPSEGRVSTSVQFDGSSISNRLRGDRLASCMPPSSLGLTRVCSSSSTIGKYCVDRSCSRIAPCKDPPLSHSRLAATSSSKTEKKDELT